jgi:hypothetical protein
MRMGPRRRAPTESPEILEDASSGEKTKPRRCAPQEELCRQRRGGP